VYSCLTRNVTVCVNLEWKVVLIVWVLLGKNYYLQFCNNTGAIKINLNFVLGVSVSNT
jgi:hypothetical protein